MNIMYIHGFGSKWKPDSEKVKALGHLGNVSGTTVSYDSPFSSLFKTYKTFILDNDIELIAGTSLGGFWAGYLGDELGVPFVAINPVINPAQTLKKYEGHGIDYYGNPYHVNSQVINSYPSFPHKGAGLILLDMGDTLLDAKQTHNALDPYFAVHTFQGGSHRFDHIQESIPAIRKLMM